MNIPTPQSIVDAVFRPIKNGTTGYCANCGIPELRQIVAMDVNTSHSTHFDMDNVAIRPAASR